MNGGSGLFRLLGSDFGCFVDGFAYAEIGAAAAYVAVHGSVNVRVGGMRVLREQRRSRHHLAGLAIAALRHVNFLPRDLDGVSSVFGKPLERGDVFACRPRNRGGAGARGLSINMAGAAAA